MAARSFPTFLPLAATLLLCWPHGVRGGAVYYGPKQPPQQHQPLPQYNEGSLPQQQQFMGNEMPYRKDLPFLPPYGKELPLQMGNERPLSAGKGDASRVSKF